MIIAIDGPAGSGKSTVAKLVARRLGFHYLDTGAMYRAVAVRALSIGASLADEDAVAGVAAADEIAFGHEPGEPLPSLISIAGIDVTAAIRTPEIDDAVSAVARMPRCARRWSRSSVTSPQASDIVVEGRDIGTVVFPDAELKVYLTATAEERARRRAAQQVGGRPRRSTQPAFDDALVRRDLADSSREHSPLAAATDAVELDTTGLSLDAGRRAHRRARAGAFGMSADFVGKPAQGPDAPSWLFGRLVRATVARLLVVLYRVRIVGVENAPATGGYILAGNHVSYLDPALLWSAVAPRDALHRQERAVRQRVSRMGAPARLGVPDQPGERGPRGDPAATDLLKAGEPIGMFPEGTRRKPGRSLGEGDLGEAHAGVAFIAHARRCPGRSCGHLRYRQGAAAGCQAPAVSACHHQLRPAGARRGLPEGGRKEKIAAMTAEIMRRIAAARDAAAEE